MITLTLIFGDVSASHSGDRWLPKDAASAKFANILNRYSAGEGKSYLPHPLLEWAKNFAEVAGIELAIEGEAEDGEQGDGPALIH